MSLREEQEEARRLAFAFGIGRQLTVRGAPISGFVSVSPVGNDPFGAEEQAKAVVVIRVLQSDAMGLPGGAFKEGEVFIDDSGRKYRVVNVLVPASGVMLEVHCVTV